MTIFNKPIKKPLESSLWLCAFKCKRDDITNPAITTNAANNMRRSIMLSKEAKKTKPIVAPKLAAWMLIL